jgi:hypothetical protein
MSTLIAGSNLKLILIFSNACFLMASRCSLVDSLYFFPVSYGILHESIHIIIPICFSY